LRARAKFAIALAGYEGFIVRIAQVSPLFESVPPRLYGGTERVVSYLTEALVELGHEVTLFASGDSRTRARLVQVCPKALWDDPECSDTMSHQVRLMEMVFSDVSRFDILHFHCDFIHFPLARRCGCPTLTTMHGRLDCSDIKSLYEEFTEIPVVSISDSQRRPVPGANWQATVYHGLPLSLYNYHDKPKEYLAFLGRVSREKGLDQAIEIARRTGHKLKVAARIDAVEQEYYRQTIEPMLKESQSSVEFIGQVGGKEKEEFLGRAKALLFPIDWPEPFGLVMIEAMACGTPVIAYNRGSVPEVLQDGVTGFIVNNADEAAAAVGQIGELQRQTCRDVFERRFDAMRMAHDYLDIYRRVIQDTHTNTKLQKTDQRQTQAAEVVMANSA
jgi:glycosyltransferase involved in cell wall biosynthesis